MATLVATLVCVALAALLFFLAGLNKPPYPGLSEFAWCALTVALFIHLFPGG